MMGLFVLFLLSSLIMGLLGSTMASPVDHTYNVGDVVPLFVNKVGPLGNPSETYQYYEMPFCNPDKVIEKKQSFGEILNGDRLSSSLYELKFKLDKPETVLCQKEFSQSEIARIKHAIEREYYFQMYYDDLPVWGFIGKVERDSAGPGPTYYLFKNIQFNLLHNNNQIIEIHAFCDPNISEDITNGFERVIEFTYSVSWKETSTPFRSRMNRYTKASLLPALQKIHWFSFYNSLVIILLSGYISFSIMKKVKNESRRYSGEEEDEDKEIGWRNTHPDIFTYPSKKTLFSAVLGTGSQLLILVIILFALSFMGILYPYSRGALSTSLVLVYTLISPVASYISTSFYCQFVETGLVRCALLTGMLFLAPVLLIILILNLAAAHIGSTAALPFGTIVVITLVYMLFGIPLLALGGWIGYSFRSGFVAPYPKKYPKEVLSLPWYVRTPGQMSIGGLLAFSVIIPELHQLFSSIWGYKIYTVPGILFITFVSLIMVTAISSVSLTYFQLKVDDSEWWWRSVLRGGSVAIFMFLYSIYFYAKSNMNGSFQAAFYFGYTVSLCFAFFLMLGAVSFYASLMLVRRMYPSVKSE